MPGSGRRAVRGERLAEGDAQGVRLRRRDPVGQAHHRAQQALQRREGERSLGLDALGAQHCDRDVGVRLPGLPHEVGQQRGLADARVAVNDEHTAAARSSRLQELAHPGLLGLPPVDLHGRRLTRRTRR